MLSSLRVLFLDRLSVRVRGGGRGRDGGGRDGGRRMDGGWMEDRRAEEDG
jgi:hypothetical protein